MTERVRERMGEMWASVLSSLIVSVIGGGVSMYVGYRLVEARVSEHERRLVELEQNNRDLSESIGDIRSDVSYIRGVIEKGK
jgi:cell division protein FtsB